MPNSVELPLLKPSDNLGRGVFSSRHVRRAVKGKIVHRVFLEKSERVESLSVDRLDHAFDETMAEIGDQTAFLRERTFYGWAVVTVEDASRDGRTVRETPKLENPYHADIDLNLPDSTERRDIQKQHALALASYAHWRERPVSR